MLLSPNQRIELILGDGEERRVFITRVEDVSELDNYLLVAAPIVNGNIVPIRRETAVTVSFYYHEVPHQGRYQATGTVDRRFRENSVPVLLVKLTSEWKKIQLRDYVRVSVFIEGLYNGTNTSDRDLSGGGCFAQPRKKLPSVRRFISISRSIKRYCA